MSYVAVGEGIYLVGDTKTVNGLDCNPYLILEGEEAVLIDPGSVLDFEVVLKNIQEIITLDKIKYIILHHQDPDFCSSVTLFEKEGLNAKVLTSWRTMTIIKYYGIKSEIKLIEEQEMQFVFKSGRVLEFIPTPYLHFPGAFVTYDKNNKTLFSSDIFGAFSYNRTIYADDDYLEKMLLFHENYMPSNAILRPVMDTLLKYDIEKILPQHGALITKNPKDYIEALRNLECGSMLTPIKKNLMKSGGHLMIFNEIYKRLLTVFPQEDIKTLFSEIKNIKQDENGHIVDYHNDGEVVWNEIFEQIKKDKGMLWISILEPFVRNLAAIYDLNLPAIFTSAINEITSENQKLNQLNNELSQTVKSVNDKLVKCPVTGLYNEVFLKSLLFDELLHGEDIVLGSLASINIDNFSKYQFAYGQQEAENVLKNLAYIFKEAFSENSVYRMDSSDFALYIKGIEKEDIIELVDQLRIEISKSDLFLGKLTISVGIVFPNEINIENEDLQLALDNYMNISMNRLRMAKQMGKNVVCYQGDSSSIADFKDSVLIADSDETNTELIKVFLEQEGFRVYTADNGVEAQDIIVNKTPKVVISEVILSKQDGFVLREKILQNSKTKDTETIFLSYKKDEESVERALSLGVTYYMKKPYIMAELVGIVSKKLKGNN